MNLKTAEQWDNLRPQLTKPDGLKDRLNFYRQIQADALRWAADQFPYWVNNDVARERLKTLANQLDPKPE